MKVVISQPMFWPWVGLFEQVRLADVFVHYDDVQLPQGRSFITRVQIKTAQGPHWLTLPVHKSLAEIRDIRLDASQPWREQHLRTLQQTYARAPFREEMLDLVRAVYAASHDSVAALNIHAIEAVAAYFGLAPRFRVASAMAGEGRSTERLLSLLRLLGATEYITGHGARNYLDHTAFEREGIAVSYMAYERRPYPQLHGAFDPHLSILDLIANQGRDGARVIASGTQPWRTFLHEPH